MGRMKARVGAWRPCKSYARHLYLNLSLCLSLYMHVYLLYLYLISVSELVSIYCYRHTTAITILLGHLRHTKSQQSPLPRGGQMLPRRSRPTLNRSGCSPTRVRRGWVPPHSIPSVRGPQAEEHRGVRAASLDGKRRWNSQQAQKALHRIFWNSSRYRCSRSWCPCCRAR